MEASAKDSDDFTCAQKGTRQFALMFPRELRKCSSVCIVLSSFFDAHFPNSKIQNLFDYKGFVTLTCMHSSRERPTPSVERGGRNYHSPKTRKWLDAKGCHFL